MTVSMETTNAVEVRDAGGQKAQHELQIAALDDFEDTGHVLRDDRCGTVREVLHRDTSRYYALRQRSRELIPAGQQETSYEARLLVTLGKVNFIAAPLFLIKKDDKIESIVFESQPLGTFADFLKDQPSCKGEPFARFYTALVADALEFLHDRDIAHRNISPSSLLLYEDGYLKLTSFNYAVFLAGPSQPYAHGGDPQYMAPEIFRKEHFGKSVDVWALGVLAHRLFAGTTLYNSCQTPEEVHLAIENRHAELFDLTKLKQRDNCQGWILIAGLLTVPVPERLGVKGKGMASLKQQPWFSSYDWGKIKAKDYDPPICRCLRSRCPHSLTGTTKSRSCKGASNTDNKDDFCQCSPASKKNFHRPTTKNEKLRPQSTAANENEFGKCISTNRPTD